jgi:AcrR family transcriptional regulator
MKKTKDILILDAALKQFTEKGFAAVRIADIAKDAGVGKGTVYEYFSSKEELLLKACCQKCQKVGDDIEMLLSLSITLDNPVKFVHFAMSSALSKFLTKTSDENILFYELSVLAASNPQIKEQARADFQGKLSQWQALVLRDYQQGVNSGHFRAIGKPEDLAEFIVATVDGLIWQMQWQSEEKLKDQAKRMADIYCQLIMKEPQRLQEYLK